MKARILTAGQVAAMQLGYRHPLDGSDLAEFRKHVHGLGDPSAPLGLHQRYMNASGLNGDGISANLFEFTSTPKMALGTLAVDKVGRLYRYCQAGASDLVVGNLLQRAAPIANHLANTPPAVAVGDTSFLYTPGATAGAENLYAEGFLQVDTTPGNGYCYKVSGHPAISASTAFLLQLDKDDPIQVALTTSSRVGLHHNRWKNVIQTPTTITARVAGVAITPITATYYGWVITRGPWPVLVNGTPAVTAPVINGGTTAGSVDVWTAAAQPTANLVGHMMQVGVSGKNNMVDLCID